MRIGWTDEEDKPGQFAIWHANVNRSVAGKRGQAMLRELHAALLALPEKRLVHEAIAADGEVCAIGAWLVAKREQAGEDRATVLAEYEAVSDDDYTDAVAEEAGAPKLVAWRLVELNDIELDTVTPEQRYARVLAWVEKVLRP
jgi:hypothetical protein